MIKDGSSVKMHYTLTVDGEVVDSSQGGEPLAYVQGQGQIIPGLERQLEGLKPGDTRSAEVAPADGYGETDPERVQKVPKANFREPDQLQAGVMVSGQTDQGTFQARVAEVGEETVTLDFNHPLAGKTLSFQVEIVEVG
jgi:FKBP-type peptidyl-prolyl cis-trans isomerase SlyD